MKNYSVSVIIPTFRRPDYLRNALNSIKNAKNNTDGVFDCEVIVVDDAHDNQTKNSMDVYATQSDVTIRYLRNSKGRCLGPAAARNFGIQSSETEIIYLLDDDDVFLANRFQASLPLLIEKEFDVVLEPSLRVYVDDPDKPSFITGPYGQPKDAFRFIMTGGGRSHIAPGATAFRKAIFDEVGGYDETLRYGEDGELLFRLCLMGRVALIEGEPVVRISIHENNSSRADGQRVWQSIKFLARLYNKMRRGTWPEETALVKRVLSHKLDLALTESRRTASSYPRRVASGAKALRYFDWRCLRTNNLKSIAVWLTKRSVA